MKFSFSTAAVPVLSANILMVAFAHGPTRKDFVVSGLEDVEPAFGGFDGDMYAGLLPIDEDEGKLMFWYFDAQKPTVEDSLIVWFNGGPGCSSFDAGLLFEFGPAVTPSRPAGYFGGSTEIKAPLGQNPYAWTKTTDTLFVEQPVGVGFSSGGKEPQDEHDVARQFTGFLQNFFDVFPEARSQRLFLVGESYAGMYISAIAHYIHNQNKNVSKDRKINLSGIAMGNAWVDAGTQGEAVIDFAWWHGMIDSVARDYFNQAWKRCYSKTMANPFQARQPAPFHSFTTPDECGVMESVMEAAGAGLFPWGAPSIYDVTTWDPYDLINAANSTIESFFNNPRVRDALHVPKTAGPWAGCIPGAGRRRLHLLDFDSPISMAPYISELLDEAGIDVLIYNGDRDLSTCSQGSELVLNRMDWSGTKEWQDPTSYDRGVWMVGDYPAGYSKTLRNLNFLVVYNSGHLVPMNVPVAAFDLITRYLQGRTFIDKPIPVNYDKIIGGSSEMVSTPRGVWIWVVGAFLAGMFVSNVLSRHFPFGRRTYEPVADA